jgi:hypothetical protein
MTAALFIDTQAGRLSSESAPAPLKTKYSLAHQA